MMITTNGGGRGGKRESVARAVLVTYSYVTLWIALSSAVILLNKYMLAYGFPYPITLTMGHMLFCALLAAGLVRAGVVASANISQGTYLRTIMPIGVCQAATLWIGNAAYLYLSVSFIQMLKALSPVAVFLVGCAVGTEKFQWHLAFNLVLITLGAVMASAGEVNFSLPGLAYQLASVVTESVRLVLMQLLLQSRGLRLNPITTLYYVAPCCFVALLVPFLFLEAGTLWAEPRLRIPPALLLASALAAFALNVVVFLLIGRTSAVSARVAGVVKDWLIILLGVLIFKAAVSGLTLAGYLFSLLAIAWYNYNKLRQAYMKHKRWS